MATPTKKGKTSSGKKKKNMSTKSKPPSSTKATEGSGKKLNFSLIDSISTMVSGKSKSEDRGTEKEIQQAVGPSIMAGMVVVIGFFAIFMGWSVLAPIEKASIASGFVTLDSNKKTIQHLEGGIISAILVKDGQYVEEGQELIRMDETTAQARQGILESQKAAAEAAEARLIAERDGLEAVQFPDHLWEKRFETDIFETLDGEQRLFETRKKALDGHIGVLQQKIKQFKDEIKGLQSQEIAARDQLALIEEEVTAVKKLVDLGQAPKPRLLALQRKKAELGGRRGEYIALIAKAKQAIAESELEIINVKNRQLNEVVDQLRQTQTKISDLDERARASKDVLDRIAITAPQSGVITGLKYHTVGGVITPGAVIMEIVPQDDILVVEAQVSPQDIDVVRAGLEAKVLLTAYKARNVDKLQGKVKSVSADRFVDEATGIPYFKAKIEIPEESVSIARSQGVELYPGMQAEVFIINGTRTLASYMISPITDTFRKAFREQ